MSLDVLLEILGALEGLAAEVALVWLQGHVNTDVRGNVVTLDGCSAAVTPLARQIQVVGALAANVTLTNVILLIVSNRLGKVYVAGAFKTWTCAQNRFGAHMVTEAESTRGDG